MDKKKEEESSPNQQIRSDLKSRTIHFISYKPRTSFEVESFARRYLEKIGFPVEEQAPLIEDVLFFLRDLRYVNDLDYAQSYILEQQQLSLPRGPRYIYQFLSKKGIPSNVIESALETHFPEDTEKFCIEKILAKKKYPTNKLIQYLLRRGFTIGLIYTLIDTVAENH